LITREDQFTADTRIGAILGLAREPALVENLNRLNDFEKGQNQDGSNDGTVTVLETRGVTGAFSQAPYALH
jgi:hypothetical protein